MGAGVSQWVTRSVEKSSSLWVFFGVFFIFFFLVFFFSFFLV